MSTLGTPGAMPRELVIASAGSGKTYYLTTRFIQLLATGTPPNEILASTFTRKAAGEILERIIERLARASQDAGEAGQLAKDTGQEPLSDVTECRALLASVLTDLHRMNVGTLDSFFVRVAQSFFQELGLAPGWTIADNLLEKRLLTDAVQTALSELKTSELAELLRALNLDHSKRSIHDDLLRKIDDLIFIQRHLDPDLTGHWQPEFGEPTRSGNVDVQGEANDLSARLEALPIPKNNASPYPPNQNWVNAINRAVPAIADRDWPAVLGAGIGAKVMKEEAEFARKPITPDFKEIFETAEDLARTELSSKYRRRSRAMGRLAELLERVFRDVQHRMGAYRFNDIGHLLGGDDPTGGRDDLQYRLDQQVRHILLDEFQDTSLLQWHALRPLADELFSGHLNERAGVIVADPKQSIYAWRGARPGLARQVGGDYALEIKSMEKSYRSTPEIIDFVARIFDKDKLPNNKILKKYSVGERVASEWLEDFTEIEAAKQRHKPGHVRIHLAPAEEKGGARKAVHPNLLRRAAEIVKCLHEEMPTRSIGVLVRSNAVLSHFMDELQALNIPASGEGGTNLTDTPPVNVLLSLLKLADHPLNTAACYHVACSPVSEVVGFKDYKDQPAARDLAITVREELVTEGYGPTLARWVQGLANHCDAREVKRLLQLVDLGYRWDDRATLRPSDFVRYVIEEPVQSSSSAVVQVMTIHKAKGLEFDVVVLPDLHPTLIRPERGRAAICQKDPKTGKFVQVYPYVNEILRPLFPKLEQPHDEQDADALRNELSVLYVALTRARYALHLVCPPEGSQAKNNARLIRDALDLSDEKVVGQILWESGDPRWFLKVGDEPVVPAADVESSEEVRAPAGDHKLLSVSVDDPTRNLARRSPSSLEGGSSVDLALHLNLDTGRAMRRGSVVHEWLEQVQWIEDGVPDDRALQASARKTDPRMSTGEVTGLVKKFRGWIEEEDIRSALSREIYTVSTGIEPRVENEMPFVRRVGMEIQEGFIDRLVLIEEEGQVVAAEVLDFKTDKIESGDEAQLEERKAHYQPQIAAYCDAVSERYGLAASEVTGKLVFLSIGVVASVN